MAQQSTSHALLFCGHMLRRGAELAVVHMPFGPVRDSRKTSLWATVRVPPLNICSLNISDVNRAQKDRIQVGTFQLRFCRSETYMIRRRKPGRKATMVCVVGSGG